MEINRTAPAQVWLFIKPTVLSLASATGRSLVEGSPTDYVCVSECAKITLYAYNEQVDRGQTKKEEEKEV